MNSKEKFSARKRIQSFRFAFAGIKSFFKSEHNAWIHLAVTIVVIGFAFYYKISKTEWIEICVAIALVFSAEMLNTAIEKICDIVSPEKRDAIKYIKDISAAAVLVCAIVAILIGCIIFFPKIIK